MISTNIRVGSYKIYAGSSDASGDELDTEPAAVISNLILYARAESAGTSVNKC